MTEYLCTFFRNGCFIRIQIGSADGPDAVSAEAERLAKILKVDFLYKDEL